MMIDSSIPDIGTGAKPQWQIDAGSNKQNKTSLVKLIFYFQRELSSRRGNYVTPTQTILPIIFGGNSIKLPPHWPHKRVAF